MSNRGGTVRSSPNGLGLDLAVLVVVLVLSMVPYVGGLGFYSDDWAFLASLQARSGEGFLRNLIAFAKEHELLMRPAQAVYLAALRQAFGLNPLPYHLVNAAAFVAMAAACLMALRELMVPPAVALAVTMLFVLLPNYSTDRMWFAVFQAAPSMACYFFSLYAALRGRRGRRGQRALWESLSIAAAALSLLLYELILPFIVVQAVLLIAWRFHERDGKGLGWMTASIPQLLAIAAAAAVCAYKGHVSDRVGGLYQYRRLIPLLVKPDYDREADYGLNLFAVLPANFLAWSPLDVARAAAVAGPVAIAAAAAIGVVAWVAIRRRPWPWTVRQSLLLAAVGVVVTFLGYGVFLLSDQIEWTRSGPSNRTHMAAAVGVAVVLVGLLGALAAAAGPRLRRDAFAVPLALLCAACSLIVSAIGVRWDQSYRVQLATIAAFDRDVGKPAPGQTVLLTGVCPSLGPAPVFDSLWDWPGALSLKTGQPLMKGDVVLPWERFGADAVVTDQFGEKSRYPYGPGLILYDARLRRATALTDRQAATAYLAAAPPSTCLVTNEGHAAPLFSSK